MRISKTCSDEFIITDYEEQPVTLTESAIFN